MQKKNRWGAVNERRRVPAEGGIARLRVASATKWTGCRFRLRYALLCKFVSKSFFSRETIIRPSSFNPPLQAAVVWSEGR